MPRVGGGNAGTLEIAQTLVSMRLLKIISSQRGCKCRSRGRPPFPDVQGQFQHMNMNVVVNDTVTVADLNRMHGQRPRDARRILPATLDGPVRRRAGGRGHSGRRSRRDPEILRRGGRAGFLGADAGLHGSLRQDGTGQGSIGARHSPPVSARAGVHSRIGTAPASVRTLHHACLFRSPILPCRDRPPRGRAVPPILPSAERALTRASHHDARQNRLPRSPAPPVAFGDPRPGPPRHGAGSPSSMQTESLMLTIADQIQQLRREKNGCLLTRPERAQAKAELKRPLLTGRIPSSWVRPVCFSCRATPLGALEHGGGLRPHPCDTQ